MKRTVLCILAMVLAVTSAAAQDFFAKGKVSLSTRDTAGAIQNFTSAVKGGQKPAEANYFLGAIAVAQSKYDDAQRYLEESTRIDDGNADALSLLSQIYVSKKNNVAALGIFKKAQKIAPNNASIAIGYGKLLLAVDSVDLAIIQLTKAKDLDGARPDVYAALGESYLKQNVPPLAIMNFQRAIELAPKQFSYRYRLAEIYVKDKKWTEAIAQYDSVATLDTTNVEAYLQVGQILIKAAGNQKKLAIKPLRLYVAKKPKSVEGWTLLTKAFFLTDDYEEAAKAARTALDLDASNPDLWRAYGKSLTEKREKDFKGAVAAYEKLKAMNALKPEDHTGYGNALVGVGREDEGLAELQSAVKLDSSDCDPYFNLGSLNMKRQDYINAAKWFEKKIACDTNSLSSYLNASACYWQLKDWAKVRQLLDRALVLKPDFLTTRLWLARYFLQTDSLDNAKEEYDRVLQEGNANPEKYKKEIGEAYSMLGSYWFTKGKYQVAVDSYKKALSFGYENSGLHLSWGQAILQTLDPKEPQDEAMAKKQDGVKHFRKSIEMEKGNALAHLWLAQGLILMRVEGQDQENRKLQEEACGEFKSTLRLQPGNQDAKKGMDRYGCK